MQIFGKQQQQQERIFTFNTRFDIDEMHLGELKMGDEKNEKLNGKRHLERSISINEPNNSNQYVLSFGLLVSVTTLHFQAQRIPIEQQTIRKTAHGQPVCGRTVSSVRNRSFSVPFIHSVVHLVG